MNTQIATTPEQSQRLIACGVNPDSADMCYLYFNSDRGQISRNEYLRLYCETLTDCREELVPKDFVDCNYRDNDSPAWSLSALLALLPTSLTSAMGNKYMLELSKLRMHNAWEVQWFNGRERWRTVDKDKKYHKLWDESPIEACVKAIEWLTANGYTLNTKKYETD